MRTWRSAVTRVLIGAILLSRQGFAQSFEQPAPTAFAPQGPTQQTPNDSAVRGLRIVPLVGQAAENVINTPNCTPPVITVLDNNDRPVEGAEVTFQAPATGAGASFGNRQSSFHTFTDSRGQAGANGYMCNDKRGHFEIQISAKLQQLTASFVMKQANYMTENDARRSRPVPVWKNWKYWAIVGGAATGAVIAILLTRSGNPPVTVSSGPIVIGSPK